MAGEKDINLNNLSENTEGKSLQEVIDSSLKKDLPETEQNTETKKPVSNTQPQTTKPKASIEVAMDTPGESVVLGKDPSTIADEAIRAEQQGTKKTEPQKIDPIGEQNKKISDLQKKLQADIAGEEVLPKGTVNQDRRKSSIRTYARDISGLISKGMSITDVAVKEQQKKEKGPLPPPKENRGNRLIAIGAVLFVLLGISAGVYAAYIFLFENKPVLVESIPSIVFVNDDKELPLAKNASRSDILKSINRTREGIQGSLGSVTNIYMTIVESVNAETGEEEKRLVGGREFLDKIDISTKASFKRSLGEEFMIGVHSFDGNKAFILFKVEDFENALPGILDWEEKILDDLWPMFYEEKPEVAFAEIFDPEASSTTPKKFFQIGFEDIILKNRDARVLEDQRGEAILIYSFPDRDHLVITTDRTTMIEVYDRITTSRARNLSN